MVCTWFNEICSCSCLHVLPGPAWVLLSKIYKPFMGSLYIGLWKAKGVNMRRPQESLCLLIRSFVLFTTFTMLKIDFSPPEIWP